MWLYDYSVEQYNISYTYQWDGTSMVERHQNKNSLEATSNTIKTRANRNNFLRKSIS